MPRLHRRPEASTTTPRRLNTAARWAEGGYTPDHLGTGKSGGSALKSHQGASAGPLTTASG